jgi:hypothetical protein
LRNIEHQLTPGDDESVAAIHRTRDLLLPIIYRLKVVLDTVTKLYDLSGTLASQHTNADNGFQRLLPYMAYHKDRLKGIVTGVKMLKEKVQDVLNMVSLGFWDLAINLASTTLTEERPSWGWISG